MQGTYFIVLRFSIRRMINILVFLLDFVLSKQVFDSRPVLNVCLKVSENHILKALKFRLFPEAVKD